MKKEEHPMAKRIAGLLVGILTMFVMCLTAFAAEDDAETYTTKGGTWVQLSQTTDATTGETTTTYGMDTDADGEYNITLVCAGNQWDYYFDVADASAEYYVTEVLNNNLSQTYTLSDDEGNSIGYAMMNDGEVKIYNIAEGYGFGSLSLAKVLQDSTGAEVTGSDTQFAFDVTLSYMKPEDAAVDITSLLTGFQTYGDVVFTWSEADNVYNASARVNLKVGESVSLTNIPDGVTYAVTEVTEGYTVTWSGSKTDASDESAEQEKLTWTGDPTGTIEKDKTIAVTCTNTEPTTPPPTPEPEEESGSFVVKKTVQNENGTELTDDSTEFDYRAVLGGLEAKTTYRYRIVQASGLAGDEQTYTTISDGSAVADFKLSSGQSAVFEGLPEGATYQVIERAAADYTASYTVSNATEVAQSAGSNTAPNTELITGRETLDKGEMKEDADESVLIHFVNTKTTTTPEGETIDIRVKKVWSDGADEHVDTPVILRLKRALSQEEADNDYGDLVDNITLDGQTDELEEIAWQYTFTDLDVYSDEEDENGEKVPYVYYFTEDEVSGYAAHIEQTDTEDGSTEYSFTVTNVKQVSLPVSGGSGIYRIIFGGFALIVVSLAYLTLKKRRRC